MHPYALGGHSQKIQDKNHKAGEDMAGRCQVGSHCTPAGRDHMTGIVEGRAEVTLGGMGFGRGNLGQGNTPAVSRALSLDSAPCEEFQLAGGGPSLLLGVGENEHGADAVASTHQLEHWEGGKGPPAEGVRGSHHEDVCHAQLDPSQWKLLG